VVIVIGASGRSARFVGSVFVGLIDTVGRAFLPTCSSWCSAQRRLDAAPAISSMLIYLVMA